MIQAIPKKLSIKPGYRPQAPDTDIEADVVQFQLLRQRSNAQRLAIAVGLTRWAKAASLRGMQKANQSTFRERFAQSVLGDKWLPHLTPSSDPSMWTQDPSEIARLLHPIFERLAIPYYITGGVAASMYGDPRTTRDMDLVIEAQRKDIPRLTEALEQAGFYCPPGAVEEVAAGQGQTLSVTHMEQLLNADIMLNADTNFDRSKMVRRRLEAIDEAELLQVWVIAPEDLILAKLLWGRGNQSEKQWRDVLGVLKVQIDTLNYAYLAEWAEQLGISEMLQQALTEAGI
ncbi:MAG: nucleotidyltransferase family protein [Trichocoleus desertorum ATA4-8-CV12]|jgi:hypothetical protein|nr:nucleotidyltransferase family protein [Trichocoleus desertorum ATA4-8-CV12]